MINYFKKTYYKFFPEKSPIIGYSIACPECKSEYHLIRKPNDIKFGCVVCNTGFIVSKEPRKFKLHITKDEVLTQQMRAV